MTGFAGQWIGRISGSINGTLTLNFDSDRPQYGLLLVAGDHDRNTLFAGNLFCHFLHDKYEFYARDITAVVHTTSPTQIPKVINAQGNFSNNSISATWTSDNKGCGYFEVLRQDESGPTPATITFDSWDSFQQWIKERRKFESRYVYRGHERNTYRLESSFHRTGRRNVGRYWKEDIPELYRALAPLLTHRFDVTNHIEFTAFLYLARHHGFPTPLLDWTASHYVAAFFAFFSGDVPASPPEYVRILEFDPDNFDRALDKQHALTTIFEPTPILEFVGAIPFANLRALPQQSKVMFSNVANAERFIGNEEKRSDLTILNKIDLKYSLREEVVDYLRYIGITPATMFPGLDGTCKALAQKFFTR